MVFTAMYLLCYSSHMKEMLPHWLSTHKHKLSVVLVELPCQAGTAAAENWTWVSVGLLDLSATQILYYYYSIAIQTI